ncbi:Disease resistance protein RPM1 [Hordeum vulgare]|nr:Disease resistance protein RPM1 [Hordeum vulgare]
MLHGNDRAHAHRRRECRKKLLASGRGDRGLIRDFVRARERVLDARDGRIQRERVQAWVRARWLGYKVTEGIVVMMRDIEFVLRMVGFEEAAAPKLELLQYYVWESPRVGMFSGLHHLPSLKEFRLNSLDWRYTEFVEYLRGELAKNESKPVLKMYT